MKAKSGGIAGLIFFVSGLFLDPAASTAFGEEPAEEQALYAKGTSLLDQYEGRSEVLIQAAGIFQQIVQKNPRSPLGYVGLARACYMNGFYSGDDYDPESLREAKRLVEKAIELDPKLFDAYEIATWIAIFQQDYEGFQKGIDTLNQLRPQNPQADLLLARQQSHLRLPGMAVRSCERALKKIKGNDEHLLLIRIHETAMLGYMSLQKYDDAERHAQAYLELDPNSAWVHGNYAVLLNAKGDYDKAIVLAKQALDLMDYGAGHFTLGVAYEGKARRLLLAKRFSEAKHYFELALSERPNRATSLAGLGHTLFGMSQESEEPDNLRKEAAARFRQALALDPRSQEAKNGLHWCAAPLPEKPSWTSEPPLLLVLVPLLFGLILLIRHRRAQELPND